MKRKIAEKDRQMDSLFLFSVLSEEIGELAKALRNNDLDEIAEEISDTIFCSICIANLFDLKIEETILKKYVNRSLNQISKDWTDVTWK